MATMVFRSALVYSRLSRDISDVDSTLHQRAIAPNVCSPLVELIEVSARWPRMESWGGVCKWRRFGQMFSSFFREEEEGMGLRSGSGRRWLERGWKTFSRIAVRGKFRKVLLLLLRCRWRHVVLFPRIFDPFTLGI